MECERVEQFSKSKESGAEGRKSHCESKAKSNAKKSGKCNNGGDQKARKDSDTRKRKREEIGCVYCRERDNVWKNHSDNDCFRNPASSKLLPRANRDWSGGRHQNRGGGKAPWSSATATGAPAAGSSGVNIDPLPYWDPPVQKEDQSTAMQSEARGDPTDEVAKVEITFKHPLSKRTYRALIDTGTTRSMVAKEVVS
ncbi:hypothetical protein PF005_g3868 [Phytophthora fragariae]|uniref:Uncharacterized protein n=1 Tax=Phytophthora fragariae TaxID=53985 RepID=A0A6A3UM09_9STRA|nr:hypothetical protein PF009_g4246 [Phytophthora fragariae]KAE9131084.1 hypothetical protein PF010_g3619 [Phytophthora fragariae]KAE9152569.1 hypothetical protein PF006_g3226 [Phytophthora fragariae]KAE9229430.1 hypothetical protein PF005_g3868 [Phytophthora fragariae]KAE9324339.1 hypothetical protein PF001_g3473 [Phytophthora fragariae]